MAPMTGPTGSGDRDLARETSEMSTSAQLRIQLAAALHDAEHVAQERDFAKLELTRAQAALAASQSDLTAALYEREKAIDALIRVRAQRERLKGNERRWAGEVEYAERERDLARAELASARKELEMLRDVVNRCPACWATRRREGGE